MANLGDPGALPASGPDGAALTRHRVWAALGAGSMPERTTSAMTPDLAAASASRREAVRSSTAALPHGSRITASTALQLTMSAPTRSNDTVSGAVTDSTASGSTPSSISPGG